MLRDVHVRSTADLLSGDVAVQLARVSQAVAAGSSLLA